MDWANTQCAHSTWSQLMETERCAATGGGREVSVPGTTPCARGAEQISSHHLVQGYLWWSSGARGMEVGKQYEISGQHPKEELLCSHTAQNTSLPQHTILPKTPFFPALSMMAVACPGLPQPAETTQQECFDKALQTQSISLFLRTTLTKTKQLWAAVGRVVRGLSSGKPYMVADKKHLIQHIQLFLLLLYLVHLIQLKPLSLSQVRSVLEI